MDRDGRAAEASSVERQSASEYAPAATERTSSDKTPSDPPTSAAPVFVLASFAPLPSTEMPDPSESATPPPAQAPSAGGVVGPRKKGTAMAMPKKTPKRTKPGSDPKKPRRARAGPNATAADGASDAGESDSGPYCICRGPDDHRWMICCERCEDWFHGECVHIGKDVGEALIERFVCPNCTTDHIMTIYKKTCALQGCRKVARLTHDAASVFCCSEHAQAWWERVLSRLPKIGARPALSDELSQEEFMALLNSGLAGIDGNGAWRLKAPFSDADETPSDGTQGPATNERPNYLTEEEVRHLDNMAKSRLGLAEETTLYDKMLSLIEWAQDRRRAAILVGRLAEDVCGYDQRLDSVCATRAFAAFLETAEGEAVFRAGRMDDPLGEGDEVRGMCEKKRCKAHSGWQKMLVLGIRHQIKEMADQADEVAKEERIVREAAGERWRRRAAEKNWVEVVD